MPFKDSAKMRVYMRDRRAEERTDIRKAKLLEISEFLPKKYIMEDNPIMLAEMQEPRDIVTPVKLYDKKIITVRDKDSKETVGKVTVRKLVGTATKITKPDISIIEQKKLLFRDRSTGEQVGTGTLVRREPIPEDIQEVIKDTVDLCRQFGRKVAEGYVLNDVKHYLTEGVLDLAASNHFYSWMYLQHMLQRFPKDMELRQKIVDMGKEKMKTLEELEFLIPVLMRAGETDEQILNEAHELVPDFFRMWTEDIAKLVIIPHEREFIPLSESTDFSVKEAEHLKKILRERLDRKQ